MEKESNSCTPITGTQSINDWLNNEELPITIWKNKYRNGNESFNQWLDRISGDNECVKQLIREKKFIFAGRILSNRGIKDRKITLSNCYVVTPPEDNLESIFEAGAKMARTFSYGGGCGLDVSKLRPKGANVNNAAKSTSGATSFMDFYSYITGLIGQEGRRGATMLSISCEHPDLEEFINLKSNLDTCTKANISVRVTDAFMRAVESGSDFTLHFTMEDGSEIKKVVNAKEVFMLLAQRNWEMAEPGILYWDRIANYNLLQNTSFEYAGVNPCVTGDTLVLTNRGYAPIASLVGNKCMVWNGYEWSEVEPKLMSKNAKVYEIRFSDGTAIKCTDYHKFPINTGSYRKPEDTRKQLKDIKIGDKLIKCTFPLISESSEDCGESMYTQGFFSGDGFVCADRNASYIKFYDNKRCCIPFCDLKNQRSEDAISITYSVNVKRPKDFVPDGTFSLKDRLDWLAGIIDSDGCLNSQDGAISISSINRDFLLNIKYLLNTLGATGVIALMHEEGDRPLPASDKNTIKEYRCQDSYRLTINASNVVVLGMFGLQPHRVKVRKCWPNRNATRFVKVVSIKPYGTEDVFCFNEPKNHTFIANGCITGNCAEEPLPAGGSCLLGSLNLSEFVKNPFTDKAEVDIDSLQVAAIEATNALNEVLRDGLKLHPLEEQQNTVREWRQIGLGTLGLGDMLIKLGIKYGSPESLKVIQTVYRNIAISAIACSISLAKIYGPFPKCDERMTEAIIASDFIQNLHPDNEMLEDIKRYGLYNSQLLTCAPTGTIGTMLQVSTGVEPNFAFSYNRRTVSLNNEETTYKVDAKIVQEYKAATGNEELPDYFVSSADIDYNDRIAVQAMLQRYIDASISSTVNLLHETTVEQVYDLYMKAWKAGLKGITIWRDGCQRQAILSTDKKKAEETKPEIETADRLNHIIPVSRKKIGVTTGSTFCKKCACGTLYITVNRDKDGNLVEVFTHTSKGGICAANTNGLTRMVSLAMRSGVCVKEITDQLRGINCPACLKLKAQGRAIDGISCPDILSKTIEEFGNTTTFQSNKDIREAEPVVTSVDEADKNMCPECGSPIAHQSGCRSCSNCGWSKCS